MPTAGLRGRSTPTAMRHHTDPRFIGHRALPAASLTAVPSLTGRGAIFVRTLTVALAPPLLALLLALSVAPAAQAICASDKPQSVLDCLETAYKTRDLRIVEELLAPDFAFKIGQRGAVKNRDWTLKVYGKLFSDTTITNLTLEIGKPREVQPGETEGTWVLDGLDVRTQYDSKDEEGTKHNDFVTRANRLQIRLVREPKPHMEIFNWHQAYRTR